MLILLTLLGAAIRISVASIERSFWMAEWTSIETASQALKNAIWFQPHQTYPPVFFLLLQALMKIFGNEAWVVRLPSLLSGIALLPLTYLVTEKLFNKKTATLTLYFVAISPFFVHLSIEVQNYGFAIFLCMLATFFFLHMLENPVSFKWRWAYISTAILAVNTPNFTIFWMIAIILFHLLQEIKDPLLRRYFSYQALTIGLSIMTIGISLVYSLLTHPERIVENLKHLPIQTLLKETIILYWNFIAGFMFDLHWTYKVLSNLFKMPMFWISILLSIFAFMCVLRALWALAREKIKTFWLFIFLCFAPIILIAILNPYRLEPSSFAFIGPFFMMLFAFGILSIREPIQLLIATAFFTLVSFYANADMIRIPTDVVHEQNYIEMTKFVFWNANKTDLVVGNNNRIFNYYKRYYAIASNADYTLSLDDLTPQKAKDYENIWVLDGIAVENPEFDKLRQRMKSLGFYLKGLEYRFGGQEDYAVANQFQRIKSDKTDLTLKAS